MKMKNSNFKNTHKFLIFIAVLFLKPAMPTSENDIGIQCHEGSVCIFLDS